MLLYPVAIRLNMERLRQCFCEFLQCHDGPDTLETDCKCLVQLQNIRALLQANKLAFNHDTDEVDELLADLEGLITSYMDSIRERVA